MGQKIVGVAPESIAEQIGCEAGDVLERINGQNVRDVIDYQFFCAEEALILDIRNGRDGQIMTVSLEKDPGDHLGLSFENDLMSPQRRCANHCLFCFVDQMPKGLRRSLYVKDDDWRLSFLQGNFITLTNVSDGELSRIIDRRVSPLYISVQATDPALRAQLMGQPRAALLMEQLKKIARAGLTFHAQLVLCPGYNDGVHLERSLQDLYSLGSAVLSVACVPVGLTRFRDNLAQVKLYDRLMACVVLDAVTAWQERARKEWGNRFVFASDEFYLLAGRDMPGYDDYEGFPQIENGVGMMRKFEREFENALRILPKNSARGKRVTLATGTAAHDWLCVLAGRAEAHTGARVTVLKIANHFFGRSASVAGLVVGQDVLDQCMGKLGDQECLLLPACMLREGDEVFLDGMTLTQLREKLGAAVLAVANDGGAFLRAIAFLPQE